jgi:hypothetical protein
LNSQCGTCILEDKKCFWWWVQKYLKPFAVPLAKKNPLTFGEATSHPELHLPSRGRIFPYENAKYSTLGIRRLLLQALCFSFHQNTQTHTLTGKSLKVTRRINFMVPKKLIHFDLKSTWAHTGYNQWTLHIP